jgi:ribosome-associated translation inhibitor RaiA
LFLSLRRRNWQNPPDERGPSIKQAFYFPREYFSIGTALVAFISRPMSIRKRRTTMDIPLTISFRNMTPSASVENQVREKAEKLGSFCDRITSCRVIVEAPHRHHHKGKAFQVRIDLSVPGKEIVINHAPKQLAAVKLTAVSASENDLVESHEASKQGAHADVYVAIRDAFNAAGRKLQDYVRRQSGAVKLHEQTPHIE